MMNVEIVNQIIRTINSGVKDPNDHLQLDDEMIVSIKVATDNYELVSTLEYIRETIEFLNQK